MAQVRTAVPDDAAALAAVHVRSWQAAYRGVLSDTFLDSLTPETRLDWWRGRLARVPPRWDVLVAEEEGEVVGFASTGTTDDADRRDPTWGELYALYVEPGRWGRGVGQNLLEASETRLRKAGFTDALLWVVAENERARRFYEAGGWEEDGTSKIMFIGTEGVRVVRYTKVVAVGGAAGRLA